MNEEIEIVWSVDQEDLNYKAGIERLTKSGRWPRIEAQINTFKEVIGSGKIFSRNKADIKNLTIKTLTDHKIADYELKFKGADNNLRLTYSIVKSDIIFDKTKNKYKRYITVVFLGIGTHSQVKTGAVILK